MVLCLYYTCVGVSPPGVQASPLAAYCQHEIRRVPTLLSLPLEPCEKLCVRYKQSSPRLIIGELLIATTNTLSVNSQFSKGVTISNALCLESRGMHPSNFRCKVKKKFAHLQTSA